MAEMASHSNTTHSRQTPKSKAAPHPTQEQISRTKRNRPRPLIRLNKTLIGVNSLLLSHQAALAEELHIQIQHLTKAVHSIGSRTK